MFCFVGLDQTWLHTAESFFTHLQLLTFSRNSPYLLQAEEHITMLSSTFICNQNTGYNLCSAESQGFLTANYQKANFDILLTVHLNIFILILTNLMH